MFKSVGSFKSNARAKRTNPPVKREEKTVSQPQPLVAVDEEQVLNVLVYLASLLSEDDELHSSLVRLANLVSCKGEKRWNCHFVDYHHVKGDFTVATGEEIRIRATVKSPLDSLILLPFGEEKVECNFPRQIEFVLSCKQGEGNVTALYFRERGIHKLIFPEEVSIDGTEYLMREVVPLTLTH